MLAGSCLMVISVGHTAWNPKLLEIQLGMLLAFSVLAFNASMLINKIKQKEQRRADDIHEAVWWGMRWTGVGTMLIAYGCAVFFLYQMSLSSNFLDLDAGFNLTLAMVAVIIAVVIENTIFPTVNPDIDPMRSGGKV